MRLLTGKTVPRSHSVTQYSNTQGGQWQSLLRTWGRQWQSLLPWELNRQTTHHIIRILNNPLSMPSRSSQSSSCRFTVLEQACLAEPEHTDAEQACLAEPEHTLAHRRLDSQVLRKVLAAMWIQLVPKTNALDQHCATNTSLKKQCAESPQTKSTYARSSVVDRQRTIVQCHCSIARVYHCNDTVSTRPLVVAHDTLTV